jgi:hypothetical protein
MEAEDFRDLDHELPDHDALMPHAVGPMLATVAVAAISTLALVGLVAVAILSR